MAANPAALNINPGAGLQAALRAFSMILKQRSNDFILYILGFV